MLTVLYHGKTGGKAVGTFHHMLVCFFRLIRELSMGGPQWLHPMGENGVPPVARDLF